MGYGEVEYQPKCCPFNEALNNDKCASFYLRYFK